MQISTKAYPKLALYIILLLLTMILASVVISGRISATAIKKESKNANLVFLNKLDKIYENEFAHINKILVDFCHENLNHEQIGMEMADEYEKHILCKEIDNLIESNRFIHSVYVFLNEGENVLYQTATKIEWMKVVDFFDYQTYSTFISNNKLSQISSTRSLKTNYTDSNGKKKDYVQIVSFIKRIPASSIRTKDIVVFNLYNNYLSEFAESSFIPEESSILVFDEKGEVFISYNQRTRASLELSAEDSRHLKTISEDIDNSNISASVTIKNEKYYVTGLKSDKGMKYLLIIPEEVILRPVTVVNKTLLILASCLFILGIIFSAIIDRRFFQPVLHILRSISTSKSGDVRMMGACKFSPGNSTKENEFIQIETYINKIITKNIEQEKQLENYFLYYRERVIHSLMNGDKQAVEMLEDDRIFIKKSFVCFSVILIYFGYEDLGMQREENESTNIDISMNTLISILEELGQVDKINISKKKIALLMSMDSLKSSFDIKMHIMGHLSNSALICSIAIGSICSSMKSINDSFTSAEKLLLCMNDEWEFLVIVEDDLLKTVEGRYEYPGKIVNQIIEDVKRQEYSSAIYNLEKFFICLKANNANLKSIKKSVLVLIYSIFIEAGEAAGCDKNTIFINNIFEEIDRIRTVRELEKWIEDIFRVSLFNKSQNIDNIDNKDLIDKVIGYIDAHFMEDIGLNTIADYVYFSPAYLGKIFKDVSGISFTDYLIKVRMESAAHLILNSNIKLTEVMEKVGYYSIQGFSRVFKNYYMCSPGEYRKKAACTTLQPKNANL